MAKEDLEQMRDLGPGGVFPLMERVSSPSVLVPHGSAPAAAPAAAAQTTFEDFYEEHHGQLFGTLCLVTRDPSEAEDIMQEAFIRVFQRWRIVQKHENPPGYLYRTAFNLQRNRRRQAIRTARRALTPPKPIDLFEAIDLRDELTVALGTLTVRQRSAVILTDLLDFPSSDAAEMLGVRASTVRVLASQGRAKLREQLERRDG